MTDYKLVPVEPIRRAMDALERFANDTLAGRNSAHELRELLAAAPAVQAVGWQFYMDGEWWPGDDRIKDHRKITEEVGFRVRDVYAAPQPASQQPDVTLLLSLIEHARCNTCDGSGVFCDGRGQPQCQWCHDRSVALAAYRKGGES